MPLETVRGPGERAGARVRTRRVTRMRVNVVKLVLFTPIAVHNPVRPLRRRAERCWAALYGPSRWS